MNRLRDIFLPICLTLASSQVLATQQKCSNIFWMPHFVVLNDWSEYLTCNLNIELSYVCDNWSKLIGTIDPDIWITEVNQLYFDINPKNDGIKVSEFGIVKITVNKILYNSCDLVNYWNKF